MSTANCGIVISAEYLTEHARGLVLDDRPDQAMQFLLTLDGEGVADAALQILKGEARFVDTPDGIVLQTEDAVEYKKDVAQLFAGRIRRKECWYVPVAKVTNFGLEDFQDERTYRQPESFIGKYVGRSWHYCLSDEILLSDTSNIIFRRCNEAPFWFPVCKSGTKALEAWLSAGNVLEERGYTQMYGSQGSRESQELTTPKDELLRRDRLEREQKEAEENLAQLMQILDRKKEEIWRQAQRKHLQIAWGTNSILVPRAPFMHWVLSGRKALRAFRPRWTPVCESGLRMYNDNPYHSDWLLGGGMLFKPLDEDFEQAVAELAAKVLNEIEETDCTVLVEGPVATGPVEHGISGVACTPGAIVVLPSLHPNYLAATMYASAVICEVGGALSHLAQVARERGRPLPMVRVQDAKEKFPPGVCLTLNSETATIQIHNLDE